MWAIIKNPYSSYEIDAGHKRLSDAVFHAQCEADTAARPTKDNGGYMLEGLFICKTSDLALYGYTITLTGETK